jgi:ATP-binding cassette subfamily G (WHITE) protein 2
LQYTYIGISLNELSGLVLTGCNPDGSSIAPGGAKCIASGEQTMQSLGLNQYSMGGCAGALLAYIFVCRFLAYLGLRYVKW